VYEVGAAADTIDSVIIELIEVDICDGSVAVEIPEASCDGDLVMSRFTMFTILGQFLEVPMSRRRKSIGSNKEQKKRKHKRKVASELSTLLSGVTAPCIDRRASAKPKKSGGDYTTTMKVTTALCRWQKLSSCSAGHERRQA
jgi:hypothetical protein